MGFDTGGAGGAPKNAEYVVLSTDADLSDERTLNAGTQLTVTDSGAGGDVTIDSGAAPSDAEYVVQTSDPDLTNGITRSNASSILVEGSFGSSSAAGLSYGTWKTVNSNHPTRLLVAVGVQTDGNSSGENRLRVDESGGTTQDYDMGIAFADASFSNGTVNKASVCVPLPAGAQVFVENTSDPKGNNSINLDREFAIQS